MAHQCLSCGRAFDSGSSELLRGCPGCGGTRFFFTDKPVSAEERQAIKDKAEKDVRNLIQKALTAEDKPDYNDEIWSQEKRREWVRLDPQEMGRVLKDMVQEAREGGDVPEGVDDAMGEALAQAGIDMVEDEAAPETTDAPEAPDAAPGADPATESPEAPEVAADVPVAAAVGAEGDAPQERRTATVTIDEPGRYNIDVERLMSAQPIIVEKDGVYMVHLPSAFGNSGKRKGKAR